MFYDQDGSEWVNVSSGTGLPGSPGQKAVKRLCVCECVCVNLTTTSDELNILLIWF